MFIKEIYIKNFGGISNKHIDLENGLNIIYGENESGKSTIFDFIYAMLFGLDIQRGKASKNDMYRKYEPWDNPAFFAGIIRFETGGKTFRLERNFYKKDKRDSLVCEDDGEELSIAHGDLDVLLDGADGELFKNTYMIIQDNKPVDYNNYFNIREENNELNSDISNALSYLKNEKKINENGIKEINEKRQKEILNYEVERKYLEEDIKKQKVLLENLNEGLCNKEDSLHNDMSIIPILLSLIGIITGIVITFGFKSMAIIPDILIGLIVIILFFKVNKKPDNKNVLADKERLEVQIENAKDIIRERRIVLYNLTENIKDETEYLEKIRGLKENIKAIEKAQNDVISTYNDYVGDRKTVIENEASGIFSDITHNRYSKLIADNSKKLKIFTENSFKAVDSFSSGTKSQADLSIRLSAILNSRSEEKLPILFDDAFVVFDDERLNKTMEHLLDIDRQIIIFTCHNREMQYLNLNNIKYNKVIL